MIFFLLKMLTREWLKRFCDLRVINSDDHCFSAKQILAALVKFRQISYAVGTNTLLLYQWTVGLPSSNSAISTSMTFFKRTLDAQTDIVSSRN